MNSSVTSGVESCTSGGAELTSHPMSLSLNVRRFLYPCAQWCRSCPIVSKKLSTPPPPLLPPPVLPLPLPPIPIPPRLPRLSSDLFRIHRLPAVRARASPRTLHPVVRRASGISSTVRIVCKTRLTTRMLNARISPSLIPSTQCSGRFSTKDSAAMYRPARPVASNLRRRSEPSVGGRRFRPRRPRRAQTGAADVMPRAAIWDSMPWVEGSRRSAGVGASCSVDIVGRGASMLVHDYWRGGACEHPAIISFIGKNKTQCV